MDLNKHVPYVNAVYNVESKIKNRKHVIQNTAIWLDLKKQIACIYNKRM